MKYPFESLTLEEKIGQLLMVSLDGTELDDGARTFLNKTRAGGVVHFGNNAVSAGQVTALNGAIDALITARRGIPPLISVDHEGGMVMRFRDGVTAFPSAMAVGATGDPDLAEAVGRAMGRELRAMGFHINMAPVLDVNTNRKNPVIGNRSFGDTPELVAAFGVRAIQGMQAEGLMACGKHFPGHGDTAVDSHYGLPCVDKPVEALERVELHPFAEAVRHGAGAIMTSHILYPALEERPVPATMSSAILMGWLRGKQGFDGLIISDGMHMQAIAKEYGIERGCVEAVKSGVDLLCVGTGGPGYQDSQLRCFEALVEAARSGEIPMARVDDAVRRVLAAKEQYCVPYAGTVDMAADAALARRVAERSVTRLAGSHTPLAGRVLCVSEPARYARYGVTEGDWRTRSFAALAAEGLGGEALEEDDPSRLAKADACVIGITSSGSWTIDFAKEAVRQGKRTVAVLTSLPYAVPELPEGVEALCTYGLVPCSVEAAIRVIKGEIEAAGKVTVAL